MSNFIEKLMKVFEKQNFYKCIYAINTKWLVFLLSIFVGIISIDIVYAGGDYIYASHMLAKYGLLLLLLGLPIYFILLELLEIFKSDSKTITLILFQYFTSIFITLFGIQLINNNFGYFAPQDPPVYWSLEHLIYHLTEFGYFPIVLIISFLITKIFLKQTVAKSTVVGLINCSLAFILWCFKGF